MIFVIFLPERLWFDTEAEVDDAECSETLLAELFAGVTQTDLPSLPHLAGDSLILEPSPAHPPRH